MKSSDYKGTTVEYDESRLTSWRWQRAVASGDTSRAFEAFDELLGGRSDAVAEELGDSIDAMQDLILQIMGAEKANAKN